MEAKDRMQFMEAHFWLDSIDWHQKFKRVFGGRKEIDENDFVLYIGGSFGIGTDSAKAVINIAVKKGIISFYTKGNKSKVRSFVLTHVKKD